MRLADAHQPVEDLQVITDVERHEDSALVERDLDQSQVRRPTKVWALDDRDDVAARAPKCLGDRRWEMFVEQQPHDQAAG